MTNIQDLDLDLLGVILSLLIPVIAYQVARHYSQHKRKNIEKILNEMNLIDNLLDLNAYFESSTSDAVIGGEINQAQMDFLRGKFEKRKKEIRKEKKKKIPSSPPRIANSSTVENGFEWTEFRKVKWFRKVGDTKWEKYVAAQKYAAPRRARDAFDCPTCMVEAGENCVGVSGTEYPWPSSKVHSARLKLLTESELTDV